MEEPSRGEVSLLLQSWRLGDQTALDKIVPLVYDELHRIAHRYMLKERMDRTLQTTALVHEAYIRLVDIRGVEWQDRAHFFAISAKLMRQILIDIARSRKYKKRGGNAQKVVIGKWLMREPKLLLLDDPTKGVDVGTKAEFYELLTQLCVDGKTILFYSSDDEELVGLCDRVLVLHDGCVRTELSGDALTKENLVASSLGASNGVKQ